jgi:hypothetical protein
VPLDRQTIQKRDFPIARRGYETGAVDGHLAEVARAVEELREEAARPAPAAPAVVEPAAPAGPQASIASSASDRVRGIVEAAEAIAADIEGQAREYAEAVRDAAERDARRAREEADAEARERVTAVKDAAASMLSRVGAVEAEVGALLEHLRTVATGIVGDLDDLAGQGSDVRAAAGHPPAPEAPDAPGAGPAGSPTHRSPVPVPPEIVAAAEPVRPTSNEAAVRRTREHDEPPRPTDAAAAGDAPPHAGERSTDEAGARMVAFSMVLDEVPREQIERHLDERYVLADRTALLDDLYARQG